jgi:hypothetical protein
MWALIFLNIILIIALIFLSIDKNKGNGGNISVVNKNKNNKIKSVVHKKNKKINSDRIFEGRFITDEEYQQMIKNRRSDISILLEDVNREYEYLKELNK